MYSILKARRYVITEGDHKSLDLIKPLWDKLNQYHYKLSDSFQSRFLNVDWDQCKKDLTDNSKDILIIYVRDKRRQMIIGFCISRVDKANEKEGEIDTLYIDPKYRNTGLGKKLIRKAIDWLSQKGVESTKLKVVTGNESLIKYYRKFGFYPIHMVLQKRHRDHPKPS